MANIVGNALNNTLEGFDTPDEIYGSGGFDRLIGGLGNDSILGEAARYHYNDQNDATSGDADYARIIGFSNSSDIIQLEGDTSQYMLKSLGGANPLNQGGNVANTGIYRKTGGQFSQGELIAVLQDRSRLNLGSDYFLYLG